MLVNSFVLNNVMGSSFRNCTEQRDRLAELAVGETWRT